MLLMPLEPLTCVIGIMIRGRSKKKEWQESGQKRQASHEKRPAIAKRASLLKETAKSHDKNL
jgi:hypothetical protein